jgi:hypothetical protein
MYSDSEISEKVTCARTKSEAIPNNVLTPYLVVMVIQDINEISCLYVSTGDNNRGSLKIFPVMINIS